MVDLIESIKKIIIKLIDINSIITVFFRNLEIWQIRVKNYYWQKKKKNNCISGSSLCTCMELSNRTLSVIEEVKLGAPSWNSLSQTLIEGSKFKKNKTSEVQLLKWKK